MKFLWFFYIGAGIDLIALLIAVGMMIGDSLKGYSGTNNPTMFTLCLGMAALQGLAFWLKSAGYLGWASALVWLPGIPLLGYGIIILLFIILRPDMK